MLFRRRHKQGFGSTLRGWLWPKTGWRRAGLYIWHRLARLPGTPESIAGGFATGVAVSFTPFLGLHILFGLLFTTIFRMNAVAMIIGTFVGNPWTFPLFFTASASVGNFMLGSDAEKIVPAWSWEALFDSPIIYLGEFLPVVFPLAVGSVPVGLLAWLVAYFVFKKLLSRYRTGRRVTRSEGSGVSTMAGDASNGAA